MTIFCSLFLDRKDEELSESFFVFFFCIGSVIDMILLIFQIHTSITILTSITVSEKIGISACIHIIGKMSCIAVSCIEELVAFMAIHYTQSVDDPTTIPNISTIEAIFTLAPVEAEITVFQITTIIRIFRILESSSYRFPWHRYDSF